MEKNEFITETQAAEMLSVPPQSLRTWRGKNHRHLSPRFYMFGRAVRYKEADIREYIEKCKVEPKLKKEQK